jgi:hypothetical protein
VVERLAGAVDRGPERPDVRRRFAGVGIGVKTRRPDGFAACPKRQGEASAGIIGIANITLDQARGVPGASRGAGVVGGGLRRRADQPAGRRPPRGRGAGPPGMRGSRRPGGAGRP